MIENHKVEDETASSTQSSHNAPPLDPAVSKRNATRSLISSLCVCVVPTMKLMTNFKDAFHVAILHWDQDCRHGRL